MIERPVGNKIRILHPRPWASRIQWIKFKSNLTSILDAIAVGVSVGGIGTDFLLSTITETIAIRVKLLGIRA